MSHWVEDSTSAQTERWGLYVHIPYCRRRCPYCDFNTYVDSSPPWQRFFEALRQELHLRRSAFPKSPSQSLYFGGGTPSLAPPELLGAFIDEVSRTVGLVSDAEITLETNPGSCDADKLAAFKGAGIGRLSLGWQSTHNSLLKVLGRLHDAERSRQIYLDARAVGYENVSVDLIFAVPGQSMAMLDKDLDALSELAPDHISLYALTYHEGTPLERRRQKGDIIPIEDDLEAQMMARIGERLEPLGYEHYEVSNYARTGFRARHNSLYWQGVPYLGLGPGAHSLAMANGAGQPVVSLQTPGVVGHRWTPPKKPKDYMDMVFAAYAQERHVGEGVPNPSVCDFREVLGKDALIRERWLTGLRYREGVRLSDLGLLPADVADPMDRALALGWADWDGDVLRPTAAGLFHADALAGLFF